MIILDTNVVSELIRATPEPAVSAWVNRLRRRDVFLTAVTIAELRLGASILPIGRRRDALFDQIAERVERHFRTPVLPFDHAAALSYGGLVALARSRGVTVSVSDGQIAAIARVHGYTVATRDTAPFEAADISVTNPWLATRPS